MGADTLGGSHRYWFLDTTEKKSPQFHNLIFIRKFSKIHTTLTQTGCEIFGPAFLELFAIASRGNLNLMWGLGYTFRDQFSLSLLSSRQRRSHSSSGLHRNFGTVNLFYLLGIHMPRKLVLTWATFKFAIAFHLNLWLHPGTALLKYWPLSTYERIIGRIWRRGYISF